MNTETMTAEIRISSQVGRNRKITVELRGKSVHFTDPCKVARRVPIAAFLNGEWQCRGSWIIRPWCAKSDEYMNDGENLIV